jgi:hypothetical protein
MTPRMIYLPLYGSARTVPVLAARLQAMRGPHAVAFIRWPRPHLAIDAEMCLATVPQEMNAHAITTPLPRRPVARSAGLATGSFRAARHFCVAIRKLAK